MTDSHELITDRVVSAAKRIEGMTDPEDLDPLDAKLTVGTDGDVRDVTAVVTTGGPHIEVDLSRGIVRGHWGSERHSCHVDNQLVLQWWEDRYIRQYAPSL